MAKAKKLGKEARHFRHILLLMRHAKTEPFGAHEDWDRQLTQKGKSQAKDIAKALKHANLIPDIIVSSAATRARQTTEKMLKHLGDKPKVLFTKALYDSGLQAVFNSLISCNEDYSIAMIVGHEPVMSMAAMWLANRGNDPELQGQLNIGIQPATLVVLGSDKPYDQWQLHEAHILAICSPKDFARKDEL